jgi:hypothetical protein
VCRLLIAPQLLAPWAATRVGGGMNRRQPDHLCREAEISLDRFSQLAPLRQELDDEMHRHPRAAKDRIAAENFRIADDKAAAPAQVAQRCRKHGGVRVDRS